MIPLWQLAVSAVQSVSDEDIRSLHERTGLQCVGRMRRVGGIFQNPTHERFDEWFSDYLLDQGIVDQYSEYGVCRPTYKREMNAISRYGLPTVEKPPPPHVQDLLLDWMEQEFGPHVEGHRVLDFGEVEVQSGTTPGIPYKWFERTKRACAAKRWDDIESFWTHAHVLNSPVLWHNFVKEELLPREKLDTDNARSITGPPLPYFMSFARLTQDFNKKLYNCFLLTSSTLGFSKFYGGLDRIAEKINRHPHKEEADMSKYDARQAQWIRLLCKRFRWRTMREQDKTPENWQRLSYYYDQAIKSYFVTGMGWVFYVDHGMMSGDPNTAADNTLVHFIALAYSYMRTVSTDYQHFKDNVEACLYGDDELISMSDLVVHSFCARNRAPHYEDCGIHFKVQSTVESTNLEGLTFLGNRFSKLWTGQWVGLPVDPRKTVASVLKPLRRQTAGQSLTRAIALLVEGYWHRSTRDLLSGFVRKMVQAGVAPEKDAPVDDLPTSLVDFAGTVPTLRMIRALWLGKQ